MKSTEQVRRKLGARSRQVHELDDTGKPNMSYIATRAERRRYEHICFFFESDTGSAINTIKTEQHTDKRKAVGEFKKSAEADPLLISRTRLH